MQFPKDQKVILALGAGVAILAAVAFGLAVTRKSGHSAPPPPAAHGTGLQVSLQDAPAPDNTKLLRCFVNGELVGTATLADCAKRNGVAAQALDVGLDETGVLAAGSSPPPPTLPGKPAATPAPVEPAQTAQPVEVRPAAACLSHAGSDWHAVEANSLNACVQALFAGQCVRPGQAVYGRWGETTLRLVPGKVEQSQDNKNFHVLVTQGRSCDLPPVQ